MMNVRTPIGTSNYTFGVAGPTLDNLTCTLRFDELFIHVVIVRHLPRHECGEDQLEEKYDNSVTYEVGSSGAE